MRTGHLRLPFIGAEGHRGGKMALDKMAAAVVASGEPARRRGDKVGDKAEVGAEIVRTCTRKMGEVRVAIAELGACSNGGLAQ